MKHSDALVQCLGKDNWKLFLLKTGIITRYCVIVYIKYELLTNQ